MEKVLFSEVCVCQQGGKGGGCPCSLVPGPQSFPRGRGYPLVSGPFLGEGGSIPVLVLARYPFPPGQDQDRGTPSSPASPLPARTRTGVPHPIWPGQDYPIPSLSPFSLSPPPPPLTGHTTDRIWRGRYASCVFKQEDFLVRVRIETQKKYFLCVRCKVRCLATLPIWFRKNKTVVYLLQTIKHKSLCILASIRSLSSVATPTECSPVHQSHPTFLANSAPPATLTRALSGVQQTFTTHQRYPAKSLCVQKFRMRDRHILCFIKNGRVTLTFHFR